MRYKVIILLFILSITMIHGQQYKNFDLYGIETNYDENEDTNTFNNTTTENDPIPIIPDFQVNENIGSYGVYQGNPTTVIDRNGIYIITWEDSRNGDPDIYAQRFSNDGTALGINFKINDDTGCAKQRSPSITVDSSCNFIITWSDERNYSIDIYAQRFNSDGLPLEKNFKVNEDLSNASKYPSISTGAGGNFIITWEGFKKNSDIFAQCFQNDGTPLGINFKVNDDENNWADHKDPSISADERGNFIITWEDERNGDLDIYAQRFLSDGTVLGTNFRVNDDKDYIGQYSPSAASDANGNLIITWYDTRNDGNRIYAQRYSNDGDTLGINFCITSTYASGFDPAISLDSLGNFALTWTDYYSINVQRFSHKGIALGSKIQVNDNKGYIQLLSPAISLDYSGNFIITWQDNRNGYYDIYAQRYSKNGTSLCSNFKVNTDEGSSRQWNPAMAVDQSGNFIIVWEDKRNGNYNIYAQQFHNNGTTIGKNFLINDDEGSTGQTSPAIASDNQGNFVITWYDQRNNGHTIFAQRYSKNGTALGANFPVTRENSNGYYPSIATDSTGNFVIVWHESHYVNSDLDNDIFAQRYSYTGEAIGNNFKVNDDEGNADQYHPSISSGENGIFIIVWEDGRNGDNDIYAQRFSVDGIALGNNFKVNEDNNRLIYTYPQPSIAIDKNNRFIISWPGYRNRDADIFAQIYAENGSKIGSNFKVNVFEADENHYCDISADRNGNFVITWDIYKNKKSDIYAQRYNNHGTPIGNNYLVSSTDAKWQRNPDVILRNDRIYTTWIDSRAGETEYDIWANVLTWGDITDINNYIQKQLLIQLKQNYPNPFNPNTRIEYQLLKNTEVNITIYNVLGETVAPLVDGYKEKGWHSVSWNASKFNSGVYFYKIVTDSHTEIKKMLFLK